ncbi:Hypothetical protein ACI5QN_04518 [Bacillus cereus]
MVIADKSVRIADNIYTFFILQKCKVNVMLTNSSSLPKGAK